MDTESMKDRITGAIEPLIKDKFFELVDIEISGGPLIRVFLERIGGKISLDDCAEISRKITEILDAGGIAGDNYSLEVSSPGINRPIKKREDFTRFAGKKVKIVTKEKIDNERVFIGILRGIRDEIVELGCNGREITIGFGNIRKANINEDFF